MRMAWNKSCPTVELHVPVNALLDLEARTSNASIKIKGPRALCDMHLKTSNGRIALENIKCKTLDAVSSNARLTLELLHRDHPEVKYIAVVSGDYHVKVGVLLFEAAEILRTEPGAEPTIQVIGWAGCKTSNDDLSASFRAGGLIEMTGNRDAASRLYYDRYDMKKYPPLP